MVRTGSIMPEWKACDVCRCRTLTSLPSNCFSNDFTASWGPDATHRLGELIAAIATPSGNSGNTSFSGNRIASMAPLVEPAPVLHVAPLRLGHHR